MAFVNFKQSTEAKILAAPMADGTFYVSTDTNKLFLDSGSKRIEVSANTNTTYTLTKDGNTITLKGSDGQTYNVTDANTTYANATTSASGLMSAADKAKLDKIAAETNKIVVDSSLSSTSTNPVQNKVIKAALDGKAAQDHTHVYGTGHIQEYSLEGTRHIKIIEGTIDQPWRRFSQQFLISGRALAYILTIYVAATNDKHIAQAQVSYFTLTPYDQGKTSTYISDQFYAGINAIDAETDKFELWYAQRQWNPAISIIPIGASDDSRELRTFSYKNDDKGQATKQTFKTPVTFYNVNDIMQGASASKPGQIGLVPAPATGQQGLFLRGDGTWAAGVSGPKGDKGETGAAGPIGPAGPQGVAGPKGEQGLRGPAGETGARGPAGPTGPQGPVGNTGATPVITATATVGSATGTPSVTVTKGGTATNPSFAFAFNNLKGATGATGPKGDAGANGSPGERGPQGVQGPQGPKGEKGEIGPKGATGDRGPQGPAGVGLPEIAIQSTQPTDSNIKIWIKI